MLFIGVDIGGTKISVCVGSADGHILLHERFLTQLFSGAAQALEKIDEVIRHLIQEVQKPIHAIGISCPGPVSVKEGKMLSPPNLPGWENCEIVAFFQEKFGLPVEMNNDGNASLLAEYLWGDFQGVDPLVYLTMSTGMGGGLFVNGSLLQGANDMAGEVGHFILDPTGPKCHCGLRGCFEVYCGGVSVCDLAEKERSEKGLQSVLPSGFDMKALGEAVREGDSFAIHVWDAFTERLAQGIGIILMTVNPRAIALGTIAAHTGDLLLKPLQEKLPKYAWPEAIEACEIAPSRLGKKMGRYSGLAVAVSKFAKS